MMTALQQYVEPLLAAYPALPTAWNAAGDEICLKSADHDGFDVYVAMDSRCLYLRTEFGYEDHWHNRDEAALEANLQAVFGLVRDLLSEQMRLRVLYANGQAYRWILERRVGKQWQAEDIYGLLLWNYFGRRSEATFSNRLLPVRGFPDA